MPPTLEEVVYDLARVALDEQRELVVNLRSRAAPVLAAASALAALLAQPAVGDGVSFPRHPLHGALVCVGILGTAAASLAAVAVLAMPDLGFSIEPDRLYRAAYDDREAPEIYLIRIAEVHRVRRDRNARGVRRIERWIGCGVLGVVAEVVGFAVALAVH